MATESHAQEIADLLLRVYEIHDWIINDTGGPEGLQNLVSDTDSQDVNG
jgi:hypothetical protein